MAKKIKLSKTQETVMLWMVQSWPAHSSNGDVRINGKRMCRVATMKALERLGLVAQDTIYTWVATEKGKEVCR